MTDIDTILDGIRSRLAKHGRKAEISRETGITAESLRLVAKPDWNPTSSTIRAIQGAIIKLFPGDEPATPHTPE